MQVEVRGAAPHEVAAFFCPQETKYDLVKIGDEIVAMAGFVREGSRLWAVLDLKLDTGLSPVLVVRGLRRGLERRGGVIFTACDHLKYPSAPKLLMLLGFKPTSERRGTNNEYEVWEWQS